MIENFTLSSEENTEGGSFLDAEEFRLRFDSSIRDLINKKRGDNSFFLSKEQYKNVLEHVKRTKTKRKKVPLDYRRLNRYDVHEEDGKEFLIKPLTEFNPDVKYYVTNDELFDILHEAHHALMHGGRNKMSLMLKSTYCNITKEMIMTYLNLCQLCRWKEKAKKKTFADVKPDVNEVNQRASVDVVDMPPREGYCHMLVYRDHNTKFLFFRPLKSMDATEVAEILLDIFTTVGCPMILQSNQGREFVRDAILEVSKSWAELKLVHGEYKEEEITAEDTCRDIENAMTSWMIEAKSDDWVRGMKFVQMAKNRTVHPAVHRSPFEALFGCKPNLGLRSVSSLADQVDHLETEEDLMQLLNFEPNSTTCGVCQEKCEEPFQVCVECDGVHHVTCGQPKNEFICSTCSSEKSTNHGTKRPSRGILDIIPSKRANAKSAIPAALSVETPISTQIYKDEFEDVSVKMEVFEDDD